MRAVKTVLASIALALAGPGILAAQDAPAAGGIAAKTVQMPGYAGDDRVAIPIHRGSGFAPLPQSSTARGVFADASRPVTVSDTRRSRVGRAVTGSYRWGAPGWSSLRTTERIYVYHDHNVRKRPRYRYRDHHLGHRPAHRYDRGHRPRAGREIARSGGAKGRTGGIYVSRGGVNLRFGF